jgi:GNAT superfamily N-acetyltransferase
MRGHWLHAPARAAEVLRAEGPRSLYFKTLGETVYRRLRLIERSISGPPPPVSCDLDVECRPLLPSEADAYLRFRPDSSREDILCRLEEGRLCAAVWHEGAIIHAGWAGLGRCWIEYLDMLVGLASDTAYVYEVFTAPEHRGKRVSSVRWGLMKQWLLDRGVHREVAATWPENRAIARSVERGGYAAVGWIGWWGLGPLRRTFCRYSGAGPAPVWLAK